MCMWQIIMNIPKPGVIVRVDGGVWAPGVYDSDERKGKRNDQTIHQSEVSLFERILMLTLTLQRGAMQYLIELQQVHHHIVDGFSETMRQLSFIAFLQA